MTILEQIEKAPESSLEQLVKLAPKNGLFMEFGVYQGNTINRIANATTNKIYGFDSFEGLPCDWHDLQKGHFKLTGLPVVEPNVELVVGWYDDTLPKFVKEHEELISFMHIDCDLYSSVKSVFNNFRHKFQNGSIIVFDEFYNYPTWEEHEYKVFMEFIKETSYTYEIIGKYGSHQVGFKINV